MTAGAIFRGDLNQRWKGHSRRNVIRGSTETFRERLMPCVNTDHLEENNVNGRTKLEIIGISALLVAALLSGVVFVPAVIGDVLNDKSQTIPGGATNDIELAWRDDLQDIYHRYNVSEDDVLFVTNKLSYCLNMTIWDNYTVVIATETGEPLCDLEECEDCEIAICTEELCMIWAQGKNLSTENLMQHRDILTDAFFKHSGGKISNKYVGRSEDLKVSEDTKLGLSGNSRCTI